MPELRVLSGREVRLAGGSVYSQSFGYDTLNRLTSAQEGSAWTQTYSYDQWGNRAVPPGSNYIPNTYATPTSLNQYSNNRWNGTGASYDNAGNQTALPSRTFTYDAENRLVSTTQPGTTPPLSYVYDGEGRRVLKTVGSSSMAYVYDGGGELAAEYSNATSSVSGTQYLIVDTLGSTRLVLNGSGGVAERLDYLPFGEEIPQGIGGRSSLYPTGVYPSTPDQVEAKFTDKLRDAETGLDFFGARYYGGPEGRFTSADAVFADQHADSPQSWNLYSYVGNNPLCAVDPTGKGMTSDILWGIAKGTGQFVANSFMPYMAYKAIQKGVNDFRNPAAAMARDQQTVKTIKSLGTAEGRQAAVTGVANAWKGMSTVDKTAAITQVGLSVATAVVGGFATGAAGAESASTTSAVASGTRYVGAGEAALIQDSGMIPNTNAQGALKLFFYTPEDPMSSASAAQAAYNLDTTPTAVTTFDASGLSNWYGGNVEGGTGIEMIAQPANPIPATSLTPLKP